MTEKREVAVPRARGSGNVVGDILGRLRRAELNVAYARSMSGTSVTPEIVSAFYENAFESRVHTLRIEVPNPQDSVWLDEFEPGTIESLKGLSDIRIEPYSENSNTVTFVAQTLDRPREMLLALEREFDGPVSVKELSARTPEPGETGLIGWRTQRNPNSWGPWIIWSSRHPLETPQDVRVGDIVQADLIPRPKLADGNVRQEPPTRQEFVVRDLTPWMMASVEADSNDSEVVVRYRVWEGPGSQEDQDAFELLTGIEQDFDPYGDN